MGLRGMVALGLLLAAAVADRFAHTASRSTLVSLVLRSAQTSDGSASSEIARLVLVAGVTSLVASFVGAAIALGVGPRATAVIGALISAVGYAVVASGGPPLLGTTLIGAGTGVFRVCPYAAAAEILAPSTANERDGSPPPPSPARFLAVSAFVALVYAGASASAGVAPVVAGALLVYGGHAVAFGVDAGVAVLAAALAGGALLLEVLGRPSRPPAPTAGPTFPYRAPAAWPPPPASTANATGALAGFAALAAAFGLWQLAMQVGAMPSHLAGATIDVFGRMHAAATIVTTLAALCLGAILVVAARAGWSFPPVALFGAGLAMAGLGLLVKSLGGGHSLVLFGAGELAASLGEATISIGAAYAALTSRGRGAVFVVAAWMAVAYVASTAGGALHGALAASPLHGALVAVIGLGCLSAGGVLVALRRHVHALWLPPAER
ncbi:MAG: hypothetical protein KF782_01410 [Labilithrix sp.]|nr:hypothetical protein [Labilithrix sp.]